MGELNISSQTLTNATAITKLAGELDSGNFDVLEDEFNKLLDSGVLGLVLDVSGLDAFSSAGLGAIINMSQLLRNRNGMLVVGATNPKIQGDLEILGLHEALTVADSMEQAKKQISAVR